MPEGGEGESPSKELTHKRDTQLKAEQTTTNPLVSFMEENVFDQLSRTPSGEDPAFWPLPLLHDLNYHIVNRKEMPGAQAREIGETFAPIKEPLRKVTTAYEILAYRHCKQEPRRDDIRAQLERDQESFERDSVELNDAELRVLSKLTMARKLPFDPQKRLYSYSEVLDQPSGETAQPSKKP